MRERVQRSRAERTMDEARGGTPGKRTRSGHIQFKRHEGATVQLKEREGAYRLYQDPAERTSIGLSGWGDPFSVGLPADTSGTVMRSASKNAGGGSDVDRIFASATHGAGGSVPFQADMEHAFGEDFSGVSAHLGQAQAMNALGAHAATQGEAVAFATMNPDRELVAHELTHVVQNRRAGGSQVAGKSQLSDPGDAAEREADQVAAKVAAGTPAGVAKSKDASSCNCGGAGCAACGAKQVSAKPTIGSVVHRSTATPAQAVSDATTLPPSDDQHAPAAQKCDGQACTDSPVSEGPGQPTGVSPVNLPPELIQRAQAMLTGPRDDDALRQLGQAAALMLGPERLLSTARDAGVPGAERRARENPPATSATDGKPIQRQAAEAATGTAATMWWLTLVDGPLPIGDIVYGALILAAAYTASRAIRQCRCTIRYAPPDIMAQCPPRVYGMGVTIGDCQNNAKFTAPQQCRQYYGHCGFTQ